MAGSCTNPTFNFLRNRQAVFHSDCTILRYISKVFKEKAALVARLQGFLYSWKTCSIFTKGFAQCLLDQTESSQ